MRPPFIDDTIENDRDIKNFEVECKCSAEVIWFRLPIEWTEAEASQQITDAKTWFRKYCIELTFKEFALDPPLRKPGEKEKKFEERTREFEKKKKELETLLKLYESRTIQIPKGKGALQETYVKVQETVMDIYSVIATAQPKKLIVLFLDEWWVPLHPAGTRVHASANHQTEPLIGLNRYDRASPLMLAHELAHGLRRVVGPRKKGVKVLDTVFERIGEPGVPPDLVIPYSTKCVNKFRKTNQVKDKNLIPRPWHDHYPSGKSDGNAILFIARTDFRQPWPYTQNHVFTVLEYLTIVAAGYVSCTEGCDVEQETRTPFYLSDVLFELGGVAHSTQGLRYPLLRGTLLPAEFTAVVQEEMPDVEIMSLPTLEESPSPFGINETSLEQPQVSAPPIEMLVPVGSVSWPEMPTPDRDVNAFYLPDLAFDMTGLAHMTPGLRDINFSNLSLLAFNLPALGQMAQTLLLRMNGSDEETKVSPDEKIMMFGELEEDATFGFTKQGLVDMAFKFIDENINPIIPEVPLVGKIRITKQQIKDIVDAINPELVTNFTCIGNCENFDSIQIEQQAPKLYGPKSAGIPIPTLGTVSLTLEVDVITAPAKANNSCVAEEELDYQRKLKEYKKAAEKFLEDWNNWNKKAQGEPPIRPKAPEPPKERSQPGRQIQQDFIIKWDVTISGLGIEYTEKLYKQTVTRYSPCCPIIPGAMPIPPVPIPPSTIPEGEGKKEDGKEEEKEFFFAGFENLEETVNPPYPPALAGNISEETGREEVKIEEREKPVFVMGLEDIAVSAEALAAKFVSVNTATILSQPTEHTAAKINISEGLFTSPRPKRTPRS
ncbi:hypothetical protein [Nitrosomonas sp. Nm166]|uniref:hypothetical protein n=1 Tax=Nitrosomonas sp. Nm166 TaxID=1881054 RepID=UPI0008F26FF1|nr:hypothetical protein [Nitrosomonas sp. Nm166]SFE22930.1 hypothetical protein SAMN05428977_101023 [Nitrosomonas sp. Nm166]